jgi:hypothetical protein
MYKPSFTLPPNPLDLVHSGDSFVFDDWVARLDNVPVFRVSGITDALARANVKGRQYVQPLRVIIESLDQQIPKKWKQFYPARSAWKPLGETQISNHLQRSKPVPFDRALMSIAYVAEFIERVLHVPVPSDYFEVVKIVPVVYQLDVGKKFWDREMRGTDRVAKLVKLLGHADDKVIKAALEGGQRMTWRTAEIIKDWLENEGFEVTVECSAGKNPKAIQTEPLYMSRDRKYPSVKQYLAGRDD